MILNIPHDEGNNIRYIADIEFLPYSVTVHLRVKSVRDPSPIKGKSYEAPK